MPGLAEDHPYRHLLSPGRIGPLKTRNRILMCPMGDNLAQDNGELSDSSLDYFEARARGGAGIILMGSVAISWPEGSYNPNQSALSDDRMIPGFRALASRVHGHGAKLVAQLSHGGITAVNDIRDGRPLWVPSIPGPGAPDPLMSMVTPEEAELQSRPQRAATAQTSLHVMTKADILWLIDQYAEAAARAQRAGLDGVEVHAGHGYLLSSFLSPAKNSRTDEYGGPFENRLRILVDVLHAIRARVGESFALWCRIDSVEFWEEGGITPELAVRTAKAIEAAGGDAIHASANGRGGAALSYTEGHTVHQPGGLLPFAESIKREVGIPVIAVGRIEPEVAEVAIAEGRIDFVAMGRKLLADPDLPEKLLRVQPDDVRPCMYHYNCIGQIFLREPVRCWNNPATGREAEFALLAAAERRTILVVGGGPAGLEVARLSSLRGHRVILCEASGRLGGRFALAARIDAPNGRMLAWLERQVRDSEVEVRLETHCDLDRLEAYGADAVVIATGGVWEAPSVPGAELSHVVTADALGGILDGDRVVGERVVVLGGGRAGISLADFFVGRGHRVAVLEETAVFASEMGLPGRWRVVHELREKGVDLIAEATATRIDPDGVTWRSSEGRVARVEADVVIIAGGARPAAFLTETGSDGPFDVHRIGDCREVGFVRGAMEGAARVAADL